MASLSKPVPRRPHGRGQKTRPLIPLTKLAFVPSLFFWGRSSVPFAAALGRTGLNWLSKTGPLISLPKMALFFHFFFGTFYSRAGESASNRRHRPLCMKAAPPRPDFKDF